nr:hypothetical protein [Bacteroidales bacterium]
YHESMFSIYDCMGGFGSSQTWMNNGLMAHDRVHMTMAGYQLCADMFFNGFLKTFDNYLEKKRTNN